MITIYDKSATDFSTLGIGVLKDVKSDPIITEVLNGEYYLEFDYASTGVLVDYILEENIIKANGEPFTIIQIKKNTTKDTITIYAKHKIIWDWSKDWLEDIAPTSKNSQEAIDYLQSNAKIPLTFTINGDCTSTYTARYVRYNILDAIYNVDNAILKRFGGELEFAYPSVYVHAKRGSNNGLSIRERKNLTGYEQTNDFSTVKTRIMPEGNNGLLLPEKYIDSPIIGNYTTPIYYKYTSKYGVDDSTTQDQAYELIRTEVNNLFVQGIDKPKVSIKLDFIELSKTIEYKEYSNLEAAHLGDTINVYIPSIKTSVTTRIVKTIYNCNLNRITKMELGSTTPTIASSNVQIANAVASVDTNIIKKEVQDSVNSIIKHPFKGYIYIDDNSGCLYVMDTTDPATATKVWKWGLGGFGYSSTGINGTYGTAITQEGQIVADYILTGTMSADRIKGLNQLQIDVQNKADSSTVDALSTKIDTANTEITDIQTNGVDKVTTTTGFTFNKDGLTIDSTNSVTKSITDEDGIVVTRKSDNVDLLTVKSEGVESINLTARNFLIKKPIRMEKTTSNITKYKGNSGLGFFYIGDD